MISSVLHIFTTPVAMVSAGDDLVASYSAEGDDLGIARFESDRRTRGNVKSLSLGAGAIEGQAGVGFDEVIVGSNLWPVVSPWVWRVSRNALACQWTDRSPLFVTLSRTG